MTTCPICHHDAATDHSTIEYRGWTITVHPAWYMGRHTTYFTAFYTRPERAVHSVSAFSSAVAVAAAQRMIDRDTERFTVVYGVEPSGNPG
jgi:hypothetical protein